MLAQHRIRELIAATTATLPDETTGLAPAALDAQIAAIVANSPAGVGAAVIGVSRAGRPIRALSIAPGDGTPAPTIMVVGGLRGDDPVGGATILALARHLCANGPLCALLGVRWLLVPCANPDHAAANAPWVARPWTLREYANAVVAPAESERCDWSGLDGRPEALALGRGIAEERPEVLLALYDVPVGGVALHQVAGKTASPWRGRGGDFARQIDLLSLPLDRGGALGSPAAALAPAIYRLPAASSEAEPLARFWADRDTGVGPASGLGLLAWAAGQAAGGLVGAVAVPRLLDYDRREQDPTPTTQTRQAVFGGGVRLWREWCAFGRTALDLALPAAQQATMARTVPYRRVVERLRDAEAILAEGLTWAERGVAPGQLATIAETFAHGDAVRVARLPALAALIGLLEAVQESGDSGTPDDLAATLDRAREMRERWCDDLDAGATLRPARLSQLVGAQLTALFLALP